MASAAEIRDEETLVEWIQWRSADEAVVLTQRAVCRALPLYGRAMREPWALDANLTALPLLRLNLTGVATARARPLVRLPSPPPDSAAMKKASDAARDGGSPDLAIIPDVTLCAADVAFGARSDAIKLRDTVAKVVGYTARASSDAERIWEQIREDARTLERDADLSGVPLWSIPLPDWFREADAGMRALSQADPAYDFWLRWWDGLVSGRQLPWTLQEKVALIPDEVWQQGAEAVAVEIRAIEQGDELRPFAEPSSLERTLERNRTAILLQFDALIAFVEGEIDLLRGQNSFSSAEQGHRERRLELLRGIVDAVRLMREAIAEAGSEATALVVVETQLPKVVTAADEAVHEGGTPGASEIIATMAITIKCLTDAGTPGHLATGIAFADMCWRKITGWRKPK